MSTLVLTSLNPNAKLDYQLHCFNQWAKLGYKIRSHNSDVECETLFKHGIQNQQLNIIPVEDTAEHLFGKPVPRILPILESALLTDHDHFILTNSDIFPAHRKVISESLESSFQSAAFTRAESLDLAVSTFQSETFYRGGLDLFWFTKSGLQTLMEKLRRSPAAERMTFGVPGWDFFIGHMLCIDQNSPFIDGSIFVHQSHKNTYDHIDEFAHYASEMVDSGRYTASEPNSLAYEFSILIREKCEDSKNTARLLKLAFYTKPAALESMSSESRQADQEIFREFSEQLLDAQVKCAFSICELEVYKDRQNEGNGWAVANTLVNNQNHQHSYMLYKLQLLLFSLLWILRKDARTLTLVYPKGNHHRAALKQITLNERDSSLDKYIFDLFATELIDHRIVNLNLMKYLFTAATNADEKALFVNIISTCKQGMRYE